MARITYSGIVTSIDGSIAGLTFQNNSSGAIVRKRPFRSKSTNERQQTIIESHIQQLANWQSLTIDQQTLWNDYALLYTKTNKFGAVKNLTGQNWFESINYNLITCGSASVLVPPVRTLPPSVGTYYLSVQSDGLFLIFASSFNPSNSILLIWCTPPILSAGKNLHSQLRLIKVVTAFPVSVIDITSDFNSYFNLSDIQEDSNTIFTISTLLQTVEKKSGLTSAGLESSFKFNSNNQGIGYWIINRDFVVS